MRKETGWEGEHTPAELESYTRNGGVYSTERHSLGWGTRVTDVHTQCWVGQRQYISPPPIFDEAQEKVSVDAAQSRTSSP